MFVASHIKKLFSKNVYYTSKSMIELKRKKSTLQINITIKHSVRIY